MILQLVQFAFSRRGDHSTCWSILPFVLDAGKNKTRSNQINPWYIFSIGLWIMPRHCSQMEEIWFHMVYFVSVLNKRVKQRNTGISPLKTLKEKSKRLWMHPTFKETLSSFLSTLSPFFLYLFARYLGEEIPAFQESNIDFSVGYGDEFLKVEAWLHHVTRNQVIYMYVMLI